MVVIFCAAFFLGSLLEGFQDIEDVLLQCLRFRLLDEFIVGYIRKRKLQRLLISLRLHACCRQDNQKGCDISVYHHFVIFCFLLFL